MPVRCIAALALAAGLAAADTPQLISSHLTDAPRIEVPHAATPPGLQADPDDPAWQAAALIPALAAAGSETALPTEVRLLWDADALYLRFSAEDPELYAPHGQTRDADHYKGDVAELFLDPVGDARQYYEVQVTPAGGVLDLNMLLTAEPVANAAGVLDQTLRYREFWPIRGWDMSDLRHAQRVLSGEDGATRGWIVDMAIPAKHVMRRHGAKQLTPLTMRANLARYEWPAAADGAERELTAMYWAPVPKGLPHISPLAMGELVLLPPVE